LQQRESFVEKCIIASHDLGAIYKFVNNRISSKNKTMAVIDSIGVNITDDIAIANAFNDCLASVGVKSSS